jgi:hypothetical protein
LGVIAEKEEFSRAKKHPLADEEFYWSIGKKQEADERGIF